MACSKHFVGDGGTDKGKNEGNTIISYEDLEKIHMSPYPDCISKGVCTVMASYSSWNGAKMHSHRHLLTDILKEKLGFKASIVCHYFSAFILIYGIPFEIYTTLLSFLHFL